MFSGGQVQGHWQVLRAVVHAGADVEIHLDGVDDSGEVVGDPYRLVDEDRVGDVRASRGDER